MLFTPIGGCDPARTLVRVGILFPARRISMCAVGSLGHELAASFVGFGRASVFLLKADNEEYGH